MKPSTPLLLPFYQHWSMLCLSPIYLRPNRTPSLRLLYSLLCIKQVFLKTSPALPYLVPPNTKVLVSSIPIFLSRSSTSPLSFRRSIPTPRQASSCEHPLNNSDLNLVSRLISLSVTTLSVLPISLLPGTALSGSFSPPLLPSPSPRISLIHLS